MPNRIILSSSKKDNTEDLSIQDLKWSLDRHISTEESEIRIAIKSMNLDLGNGITINLMLEEMNSNNCFDFDYKPIEKDRLIIALDKNDHKYFGLIFRNGKWIKGDYYTNRLPYKGIRVFTKRIGEGKIYKMKV